MKEQLQRIHAKNKDFNAGDMAGEYFGFRSDVHYDMLVVAPAWQPTKILKETDCEVTVTAEHTYTNGYEVVMGGKRIAWMQCASGACNLIDHLLVCLDLDFDKLVFLGAVGALKPGVQVGDVCTPVRCIAGTMADAYLLDDFRDWQPFREVRPNDPAFVEQVIALADFPVRKAGVYCTDSISCEYYHLDFIKGFDVDLIEMETSSFYRLAGLMEKKAVALLAVSDNSAVGEPLLGLTEAQRDRFHQGRNILIPRLLEKIAQMD